MFKKMMALLLVLTIVFAILPPMAQATETGTHTSVDNGEVTVEGTNSFGTLLSEEINESQESADQAAEEYEAGYSVTDLVIEGNVATVTYDTLETANLVVAIYTEDGLQLVTSGNATVEPEETTATVTIAGEMPQYFMAAAYLLDTYDLSPLCPAYDTPMYTQDMQELLASTVEDYDADRVLQLDDDTTTNFAVYADSTKVIEYVDGYNVVTSVDDENATYVIDNADEQITGLNAGDVFVYAYSEVEMLIVKVDTITIDGTTATITGDEVELEEVFSHVKVEGTSTTEDVVVDDSTADEGVTYLGLVADDKPVRAFEGGGNISIFHDFKFELKQEKKNDNTESVMMVTGSLKFSATGGVKYYISLSRQYIEFKITPTVAANFTVSGKFDAFKKLGSFGISPVPGIFIGFEPKIDLAFDAMVNFNATLTWTLGGMYENKKGFQNLTSSPVVDFNMTFQGTIFFGIDLGPKLTIINDGIACFTMNSKVGARLIGTMSGTDHEIPDINAASKHLCQQCFGFKVNFEANLSGEITFLKLKWLTVDFDIGKWTVPLGEWFWSTETLKFAKGACPYKTYRVTINVKDSNGAPLSTTVTTDTGESLGTSNSKGVLVVYLPAGKYTLSATVNGSTVSRKVNITEAQSVSISGLVGNAPSLGYTPIGGKCGSNVTWQLYSDGRLVISGTGPITNSPWSVYKNVIKSVTIHSGVTSIGDFAFKDCGKLTSVTIPSSITSIGRRAFTDSAVVNVYINDIASWCNITYKDVGGSPMIGNPAITSRNLYLNGNLVSDIVIPDGVKTIAPWSFYYCSSLTSVTFSNSVTSIGVGAFDSCDGLMEIIIPSSVTQINMGAFTNCHSLLQINVDANNNAFSSDSQGVLYNKDKTKIISVPAGKTSVTIPDSVNTLGNRTFMGCNKLTSIEIPNSVNRIEDYTFAYCHSIPSVVFPSSITYLGGSLFIDCTTLKSVVFRGSAPSVGKLGTSVLFGFTGTVYYPSGDTTWTNSVMQEYSNGGNVMWRSYIGPTTTKKMPTKATFGGDYSTEVKEEYVLKTAAFADLVPGKDYVLLALADIEVEDLLAADNVLYIDQGTAGEDGTLTFQYVQRVDTDTSYVMACGASDWDLNDATITFPPMIASEETKVVSPTVEYDGKTLVEGRDYVITGTVDYTEVGTYTCYIRGIYDYTGTVECTYDVTTLEDLGFKFNTAAPALSDDIVMNIATTIPAGFSDPYMVVEFNGVTSTITDYTINPDNGRYVFAFPGINPQTMGDTFHATVYAAVGGYEVSVDLEYSMIKYINSQLKKSTTPDALRTALSDLVMYGEANQVYEDYKTDALLSTLLESTATLTPSTFPGLDASYNKQVTAGTMDANIDLKGVTMALGSKVAVRLTVFCADPAAYTVKVTINGEDFLYPVSELALADGYSDRYVVEFDQIRATQFGEEITFSFLDAAGNQVGRTLTYTVYTYVQKNQAAANENLVNLLKAIYNYGESVKNI